MNAPIYYLIWRYAAPETYENGWLRLLCAVLCLGLVIGTLFSRHREQLEILTRRNIQLEAECEEKLLFIANLSHDLRTPLSGLLSLAEIELQQLSPDNEVYPTLTTMHQLSQQLHSLFESLFRNHQTGKSYPILRRAGDVLHDSIMPTDTTIISTCD